MAGSYTSLTVPGETGAYSEKLTKKQAKAACEHQQVAIESNFTNGITDNGNLPLLAGESIKTECNILIE